LKSSAFLPKISISIVSHLQIEMVIGLLCDINKYCYNFSLEVILTLNIAESVNFDDTEFSFPIIIIKNPTPQGFGTNHNQAFSHAHGLYFCVMNPDIRLSCNPFESLIACFSDASFGVVAPLVLGADGGIEDSARYFPSPLKIVCKVFGGCRGSDYPIAGTPFFVDWVGGMCMLFPAQVFRQLSGFDQRYFLYYEDVDLCGRLKLAHYQAVVCPQVSVIHHAHRSSHRHFKYLRWHLSSMLRFFLSTVFWRLLWRQWVH
jgi:GT2 family glycosyltransferase